MEKEIEDARHTATRLFYWVREDSTERADVDNWRTRRVGQLRERAARLERPLGGRSEQA